jgi:hypothetical protein
MKNFFENISEENKKYIYWFVLALSSFVIVNVLFDPFGILQEIGAGIIFSILWILYYTFSISLSNINIISIILSIIFSPVLFYILYNLCIKKIHFFYFLFFIDFLFIALSPLLITILFSYSCFIVGSGDWGCFLPIVTIPIIIISSLIAYFFYRKSEGLK